MRIDVRDLRWTRELWEVLVLAYPYGLQHSGVAASSVYKLSGTRLPYVRADWFVAQASRPPLYYALLQLPETLDGGRRNPTHRCRCAGGHCPSLEV